MEIKYDFVLNNVVHRKKLLRIAHPFASHNGNSNINFDSAGNLILLTGDGGSEFDPFNLAQNNKFIFGKILLINTYGFMCEKSNNNIVIKFTDFNNNQRQNIINCGKGIRNPVGFDEYCNIKFIPFSGQDYYEPAYAFTDYCVNFGWRAWEGQMPTMKQDVSTPPLPLDIVVYRNQAEQLSCAYKSFVSLDHNNFTKRINALSLAGGVYYNGCNPTIKNKYITAEFGYIDIVAQTLVPVGILRATDLCDSNNSNCFTPCHKRCGKFFCKQNSDDDLDLERKRESPLINIDNLDFTYPDNNIQPNENSLIQPSKSALIQSTKNALMQSKFKKNKKSPNDSLIDIPNGVFAFTALGINKCHNTMYLGTNIEFQTTGTGGAVYQII